MKKYYWLFLVTFIIGVILPHSDLLVIIWALTIVFQLPILCVLLITFIVDFIEGYKNSKPRASNYGKIGLITLSIFIASPVVSVYFVDKYFKFRADLLISDLEKYYSTNGTYPNNAEEINLNSGLFNVKYNYSNYNKNYKLTYSSRGTVITEYNNQNKTWENYGWND